jgi:hypothetical protein
MADRFWSKVDIGSHEECWPWLAFKHKGYGRYKDNNKNVRAHRYSFFLANGFYPPVVMHTCDNPTCVNPAHLLEGTQALNAQDMVAKGRHVELNSSKTHCPSGHEYSETNTYVYPSGARRCHTCRNEQSRRHYAKTKKVVLK